MSNKNNNITELTNFLSSQSEINKEDKKFVYDFYNKFYYLGELNENIIADLNDKISIGYGNYNSKIMIVLSSENILEETITVIKPIIENINISLWNVYITVVKKSEATYDKYDAAILNEINAVNPSLLYVIDKDIQSYYNISKGMNNMPRLKDVSTKFINEEDILFLADKSNKESQEEEWQSTMQKIWLSLRLMINFKDKEIIE